MKLENKNGVNMGEVGNNYNRELLPEQPVVPGIEASLAADLVDVIANLDSFFTIEPQQQGHRAEHPNVEFIIDLDPPPARIPLNGEAAQKRLSAKPINPDDMIGFRGGRVIITDKAKEKLEKTMFRLNGKLISPDQAFKVLNIPGGVKGLRTVTHEVFLGHYKAHLIAMQILNTKKSEETSETQTHTPTQTQQTTHQVSLKDKSLKRRPKGSNVLSTETLKSYITLIIADNKRLEREKERLANEVYEKDINLTSQLQTFKSRTEAQGRIGISSQQEGRNEPPKGKIESSQSDVEKRLDAERHNEETPPPNEPSE